MGKGIKNHQIQTPPCLLLKNQLLLCPCLWILSLSLFPSRRERPHQSLESARQEILRARGIRCWWVKRTGKQLSPTPLFPHKKPNTPSQPVLENQPIPMTQDMKLVLMLHRPAAPLFVCSEVPKFTGLSQPSRTPCCKSMITFPPMCLPLSS